MKILPIRTWNTAKKGYVFGVPTFYNNFHLGPDLIVPQGTLVYACDKGVSRATVGPQGGNRIELTLEDGTLIRHLHLSKFGKVGNVLKNDIIGYTGNTGLSTAPHIHIDVFKGKYIDPLLFFKQMFKFKVTYVNGTQSQSDALKAEVLKYSRNQVELEISLATLPPVFAQGILSGEEGLRIINQYGLQNTVILPYTSQMTDMYAVTHYDVVGNRPYVLIDQRGIGDARSLAYEMSHCLQKFYNMHKPPGAPSVQVDDVFTPDDNFIYRKYDLVTPLLPLLEEGQGNKPMTKEEVNNQYILIFGRQSKEDEWKYWEGRPLLEFQREAKKGLVLELQK